MACGRNSILYDIGGTMQKLITEKNFIYYFNNYDELNKASTERELRRDRKILSTEE